MAIALVSVFVTRQLAGEESELVRFLNKRYDGQFSARSRSVGRWLITEAHADPIRTTDFVWDEVFGDVAPTVVVQSLESGKPQLAYEIGFGRSDWGTNPFLTRWEIVNLDEDAGYEIVGEWGVTAGGPGGFRGLVVFDADGTRLRPMAGYPFETGNWTIKLSDILQQENSVEFPTIDIWSLTRYEDINGDGKSELLYGNFIWDLDAGESRSSPHIWNLSVFQLERNQFVPASWWNNGQTFRTTEKISEADEDEVKLLELFRQLGNGDQQR